MQKHYNSITLSFLLIFSTLSSYANTPLFPECNIPSPLLDASQPDQELVQRFKNYERDSLQFETNNGCILRFYSEFVYSLRRIEENEKALILVDSVLKNIPMNNLPFDSVRLLVEKGVILSKEMRDDQYYNLLDTIEAKFNSNLFFASYDDQVSLLNLISIAAGLFSDAQRYQFANELLLKQLELNTSQDSFYYFHNWFMIGMNNLNNYSYHKANEDFSNAYKYSNSKEVYSHMLAELAVLKGTTLIELDSFDKAIHFFKNALSISDDILMVETYALIGLAKAYNSLSMQDSVKQFYSKLKSIRDNEAIPLFLKRDVVYQMAIDNAFDSNLRELKYNNRILQGLIDTSLQTDKYIFYQVKSYITALEKFSAQEFQSYLTFRGVEKERKINREVQAMNSLKLKYDTEKKESQNQLLLKEQKLQNITIQNQRKRFFGLLAGAILFAIIIALLYQQNKIRQKNNLALAIEKEKVEQQNQTLSEKNKKIQTLHKDLNHRINNNLQLLTDLMSMQSRQVEHPEAKQAVAESEARIAALSLMHKNLSPDSNSRDFDLAAYINELCQNLIYSFPDLSKKPVLNIDIDDISLDAEKCVWIGLIVNELMTNSFKYAFKEQGHPQINITIISSPQGSLDMNYSDNGIGLPDNIKLENITSSGLKLIHTFAKQLEGSMNMENKNGANFKFLFKNLKYTG